MGPRAWARAGVSDREAEVLDLVGGHLSNAQIGRRLVISVRTVESHVSSLLRKPAERARCADRLERGWAWETDMRRMCPSAGEDLARWWGKRCRAATSPGAARALIEMASLIDVRDVLGAVRAPALVLHRRFDTGAHIGEGALPGRTRAGRRFVELDGTDHFVGVDPDQVLEPVEEFVAGLGPSTSASRSLTTLLAVHHEGSLDAAWVRGMARDLIEAHRGTPALAAQVGVLATFDGRGRALRCGLALREHAAAAGLRVSVGLLTAEVARRGAQVSGDGVAAVQAVADRAALGEVWVTSTLRGILAGSCLSFERRAELEVSSLGRGVELDAVA